MKMQATQNNQNNFEKITKLEDLNYLTGRLTIIKIQNSDRGVLVKR